MLESRAIKGISKIAICAGYWKLAAMTAGLSTVLISIAGVATTIVGFASESKKVRNLGIVLAFGQLTSIIFALDGLVRDIAIPSMRDKIAPGLGMVMHKTLDSLGSVPGVLLGKMRGRANPAVTSTPNQTPPATPKLQGAQQGSLIGRFVSKLCQRRVQDNNDRGRS